VLGSIGEVPAEELDLVGQGPLLGRAVVHVEVVDGVGAELAVRTGPRGGTPGRCRRVTESWSPTWTSRGVRSRAAWRIGRLKATSRATRAHTSLRQVGPASAV